MLFDQRFDTKLEVFIPWIFGTKRKVRESRREVRVTRHRRPKARENVNGHVSHVWTGLVGNQRWGKSPWPITTKLSERNGGPLTTLNRKFIYNGWLNFYTREEKLWWRGLIFVERNRLVVVFFFKCMCLFWRSSLHSVGSVIYWWRKPTKYERWTLCIGSPLANLIKKEQKQTTASKWVLKWFRLLFFLFFSFRN